MFLEQIQIYFPEEGIKILVTLFLSFVVGLGREGERSSTGIYYFGGIRTFPLLGLLGYGLIYVSRGNFIPFIIGFFVIGALMALSYFRKFAQGVPGFTTELAGLVVYLVGGIVSTGSFWVATTLIVITVFLLEMKPTLAKFGKKVSREEMITLTKFLLLLLVILPIAPNKNFTQFEINPFRTWLVVVAVSGISYGSYILQRKTKSAHSILISAILGGIYSSTMTTIVLSRKSRNTQHHFLYSGAMLVSSSIMYLRVLVLVCIFNKELAGYIALPFITIGLLGLTIGLIWSLRRRDRNYKFKEEVNVTNPLEIKFAFLFAILFIITIVVTKLVSTYLGSKGVYTLAGLMGLTEIDPFILGITQNVGRFFNYSVGAISIIIAASFNNIAKAFYALLLCRNKSGLYGFILLVALAILGFTLIIFIN